METGKALEIVHTIASEAWMRSDPGGLPGWGDENVQEALDTVEDFIVNNFADEETPYEQQD